MAQPGVGVDFETGPAQEEIELVLQSAICRFAIGIARQEQVIVRSGILGALANSLVDINTALKCRDFAIARPTLMLGRYCVGNSSSSFWPHARSNRSLHRSQSSCSHPHPRT
jgi:hypothetical protein